MRSSIGFLTSCFSLPLSLSLDVCLNGPNIQTAVLWSMNFASGTLANEKNMFIYHGYQEMIL